ncbi:microsomal epoxide hydrolase [Xylariales sp. AK1849]|nr:microsomal epoxide hydrolase [Xylariales sp. AK1849]
MADIKAFRVAIPDSEISDLKARLSHPRFPDELDEAGWDLGAPLGHVERLAKYWGGSFDWRRAEAALNEFPQFTTELQADGFAPLNLHFIHQKSDVPGAIPLLFVHGWPGSFYEGTKIIKPLVQGGEGGAPAFHVVVPSLPNFGFSDGTKQRGFAIDQHAEVLNQLMLKLGYNEYATQGGDWGWAITRTLSLRYPQHAKAQHLNMSIGGTPRRLKHPLLAIESAFKPWTEADRKALARTAWFRQEGSGYNQLQATKPQTIGYALADSPVALLAWVYEKLHDWTDSYPWTDDEICTWISIYWFSTAGPAASVRLYYEQTRVMKSGRGSTWSSLADWQNVKVGLGHFPGDIVLDPSVWTRTLGHIVYEKDHPGGGHFAAWEKPEAIVGDLREMFGAKGGAREVVKASRL